MSALPRPIHDAAAAFDGLPGVGPRAALRYAYWLAAQPKEAALSMARAFERLAVGLKKCEICGAWSDIEGCPICPDTRRDAALLCIVGTSQDIRVIEESGAFRGKYHVLGGLLDPIEGRTPETLNLTALYRRLESDSTVKEIIIALDPDVSGDMTALYLIKQLARFPAKLTRLARGLQNGAQIEYADGATIADALLNRRDLERHD
jgi:recombination protein RecR